MDKRTHRLNKLVHRVGRRGSFLLFLAFLDIVYAFSLAFPTATSVRTPLNIFLVHVMPLAAWACIWAVVGAMCLVFAFRTRDAYGYAAAIFLKGLWSLMNLIGWTVGYVERGWISAAIWGAFFGVLIVVSGWPDDWKHE